MSANINNNTSKCNIILTIAIISFIVGLIMFFVKTPLGILLLLVSGGFNLYLNKKYPDFVKSFIEDNKKTMPEHGSKDFNIIHIQGVNFVDYEQKIHCKILNGNIVFYDSQKEFLSIEIDKIENAMILEETEQTQKNKSVAARAIVGGLLLGPVGAVVGGLSGVSPKLETNKKYFLEISIPEMESIIITTNNKTLKEIKKAITK